MTVFLAAGCASPTLPLPPPTALVEAPPNAEGMVVVTGDARPGAFVSCLNQRTEDGVIVRTNDSGRFSLMIAAEGDDLLSLWQFENTGNGGQQVDVFVPPP